MKQVHVHAVGRMCRIAFVKVNPKYKKLELVACVSRKLLAKRHAVLKLRDMLEIVDVSGCCHALEIAESPEAVECVEEVWILRVYVHGTFHFATRHDMIVAGDDHRVRLARCNARDLDSCFDPTAFQINLPKQERARAALTVSCTKLARPTRPQCVFFRHNKSVVPTTAYVFGSCAKGAE